MTKDTKSVAYCLNCNRPETVIPMVSLRYAGSQTWICSQCLPILIHHADQLAPKLAQGEQFVSTSPEA